MTSDKFIKTSLQEFLNENYLKSDAIGYSVGEYIYHVSPKKNLSSIKKYGFMPKDGVSINGKEFENRLYFATSLIAAYDISVNFSSYKDYDGYVIFKLKSECLSNGYEEDNLFVHGIYVDYPISDKYIVEIIDTDDLFDKYDGDDLDGLY